MKKEIEDLTISTIVLMLLFSNFQSYLLPLVVPAVVTAFLVHELAHRWTARKLGYVTFYRRWDAGIVLAILMGIATKILIGKAWIFAALGSVQVYTTPSYLPLETKSSMGRVAIAGPLANIIVAALVYPMTNLFTWAPSVVRVNLWVAFFNLLPVPPLDGWKIPRWSAGYWALSTGVAYTLLQVWG